WKEDAKADLPAFSLSADEADRLARALGGLPPTKEQWDRAAGFEAIKRPSPFVGGPAAAVNRWKEGPRSTEDHGDASAFNVFDMGGNGTELTRDLVLADNFSWKNAAGGVLVILRGQRYSASTPLRFDDLVEQQKTPQVQFYTAHSPFTSFRVVLE